MIKLHITYNEKFKYSNFPYRKLLPEPYIAYYVGNK